MRRPARISRCLLGAILGAWLLAGAPAARAQGSRTSVRVVAAGDIACDPREEPGVRSCQQAATAELALSLDPDAVLVVGDLQYPKGELRDFQRSYDPTWGALKAITYPVPGNHEYYGGGEGYYAYWGERAGDPARGWYSFDLGAWHVLALNSNCDAVGGCGEGSPQVAWIRSDLAAHPSACALAYFHHPRFSSGLHGNEPAMAPMWRALQEGGVDVVLSGHDHDYERFAPQDADGRPDPGGIREFVVGTGGAPQYFALWPRSNSEALRTGAFGVLLLSLEPDAYAWSFEAIPGTDYRDQGRTTCH